MFDRSTFDEDGISTAELVFGPPGSEERVREVGRELGFEFPEDYVAFMGRWNGADGFLEAASGTDGYVQLYPIENLPGANVPPIQPDLVQFGSNGSGEGFFFVRETNEIVERPLIGDPEDALTVGSTFREFVRYISRGGLADYPESLSPSLGGEVDQ